VTEVDDRGRKRLDPAHWEARYCSGDIPWELGHHDPYLEEVIEQYAIEPCRALEVGCGQGHNAIWLAQRGFEVLGIDLSATAIKAAQGHGADQAGRCRFEVGDLLAGPAPESPHDFAYDRAVMHLFEEAEHRERYAANLAASMRPGALYHTLSGSTDGPPRDSGPPRRSATEMIGALEPHFELVSIRETAFDPAGHAGAKAWVIVARRR